MHIRSIRILMLFALTMVVMAACDQGKTLEGTTTQLGSIQGRVTEGTPATAAAATASAAPSRQAQAQLPEVAVGAGLPGVRVTVFLKGQLKTTKTSLDNPKTTDVDEGGYFTIPGLPAGVLLPVTFDRQSYVKLNGNVEIPAVAGSGDSAIPLKDPVASIEVAMVKGEGSASLNLDRLIKFKGLLQGIVVDGTPGADRGKALGDVTISLFVGGTVITTKSKTNDAQTAFDETGFFSIGNLPPGQPLSATFELKDYQRTRITVTIPVAQGTEEPAVNVEVKLVKGDITKIIEDTVKPLPFNGTIQGIIRDGTVAADTFGKPLSGVTVAAFVLGKVVETTSKEDDPLTPGFDETGFFALNNLPIKIDIPVRFKLEGYVPLTSVIKVPDPGLSSEVEQEAAQVTVDIDLVKDSASLLVVVYAGKGAANGATVVLDLTDVNSVSLSNSTGVWIKEGSMNPGGGFDLRQVKTTDANGQVTFDKLPPIVIPQSALVVQPFDESGDKTPDYLAYVHSSSLDLRQLSTGSGPNVVRVNLVQSSLAIAPKVIWTNVVDNTVLNTGDVLKFIFDYPMDTMPVAEVKDSSGKITTAADPKNANFAVTLVDPDSQPVPFNATWKDNVTLEVDPISDLQPTHKVNFDPTNPCSTTCYVVTVRARSIQGVWSDNGTPDQYVGKFKVTEKAAALTSTAVGLWPSPDGTGLDWNTTHATTPALTLSWGQDANATGYNIYAKDNGLNKDWVRVSSTVTFPTTAAQVGTTHSSTIVYTPSLPNALPTQFDRCQANNAATVCTSVEPLAFGGQITFAVTTLNRDGIESAIDETKVATARDTKAPSLAAVQMGGQLCPKAGSAAAGTAQVLAPGTQAGVSTGTTADNETAAGCPFATTASCSAAKTIRILVKNFPEPMNGGGGSPSVINTTTAGTGDCAGGTVTSNSADPTIVGSGWTDDTAAYPGLRQYYVDIGVPAGKNSKGDCVAFNFAGAADAGGNAVLQTAPSSKPDTAIVEGRCKGEGTVIVYKLE